MLPPGKISELKIYIKMRLRTAPLWELAYNAPLNLIALFQAAA